MRDGGLGFPRKRIIQKGETWELEGVTLPSGPSLLRKAFTGGRTVRGSEEELAQRASASRRNHRKAKTKDLERQHGLPREPGNMAAQLPTPVILS